MLRPHPPHRVKPLKRGGFKPMKDMSKAPAPKKVKTKGKP